MFKQLIYKINLIIQGNICQVTFFGGLDPCGL